LAIHNKPTVCRVRSLNLIISDLVPGYIIHVDDVLLDPPTLHTFTGNTNRLLLLPPSSVTEANSEDGKGDYRNWQDSILHNPSSPHATFLLAGSGSSADDARRVLS